MKEIEELTKKVEKEIEPEFKKIEEICKKNSIKVIEAFQKCNLQEMHLQTSTGYGIDEPGRNKIEEIYAKVFKSEDALVRAQFISGTHALAITLSALLRPNDTMISITGYITNSNRMWRNIKSKLIKSIWNKIRTNRTNRK